MTEIFDDIKVGKGIANALRFFGERGMLGKDKYFEDGKARHAMQTTTASTDVVVGRTKDQTLEKQLKELGSDTSQINDRVKLKYTDKEGNKLTLKQAFREMCWSFHGRAPSHWRQEKQNRQINSQLSVFKQNEQKKSIVPDQVIAPVSNKGKETSD